MSVNVLHLARQLLELQHLHPPLLCLRIVLSHRAALSHSVCVVSLLSSVLVVRHFFRDAALLAKTHLPPQLLSTRVELVDAGTRPSHLAVPAKQLMVAV